MNTKRIIDKSLYIVINKIYIDQTVVESNLLKIRENQSITINKIREVEEIFISGRDMPYSKHKRNLPIEFSIDFEVIDTNNYNENRITINEFFNKFKEKVMSFGSEYDSGVKIYDVYSESIQIEDEITMRFNFMCYPELIKL